MESGFLVIASIVLIWPLTAGVVAGLGHTPRVRRWRPFAWSALAAAGTGAAMLGVSMAMFATNGTTRSMAALGPQIGGAACLAGAVTSGLIAGLLRAIGGPSQGAPASDRPTSDRPTSDRSGKEVHGPGDDRRGTTRRST